MVQGPDTLTNESKPFSLATHLSAKERKKKNIYKQHSYVVVHHCIWKGRWRTQKGRDKKKEWWELRKQKNTKKEKQTDRETDRETDRQKERKIGNEKNGNL